MLDQIEAKQYTAVESRRTPPLFKSFWMGGFECSSHINAQGERLDLIASVQHDSKAFEDYVRLQEMGLRTVRDGVRWNLVDHGGGYDFRSFAPMLEAAIQTGTQVIWDLCHYGFPDDEGLLRPSFVDRFAKYARAVASFFAEHTDEVPFWTPMNEISFFAWGASRQYIYPYATGRDNEIKRQLVRATIAAAEAVRDVDARARLVYPEPILHVIAPPHRPNLSLIARRERESQYEAWDMIAGYRKPKLGGSPKYLDIVGANFYYRNQWEQNGERAYLRWEPHDRDPRWAPLSDMLAHLETRYGRPILLSETGHFGKSRGLWIREIGREAHRAKVKGVALEGVCLYPIIDRHDWDATSHWHCAGLWDLETGANGDIQRVLNPDYAEGFRQAQAFVSNTTC